MKALSVSLRMISNLFQTDSVCNFLTVFRTLQYSEECCSSADLLVN